MILGRNNLEKVKHRVDEGEERIHQIFYSLSGQWEAHVQKLAEISPRNALVRTKPDEIEEISAVGLPAPFIDRNRPRTAHIRSRNIHSSWALASWCSSFVLFFPSF